MGGAGSLSEAAPAPPRANALPSPSASLAGDHAENNHTVTILFAVLAGVFAVSLKFGFGSDRQGNLSAGLFCAIILFSVFAAIHFPKGVFLRPSIALWRVVSGLALLYLVLLVFLLFQDVRDVRRAVNIIDPATVGPVSEKSYGGGCKIYDPMLPDPWSNVKDKIDIFVIAHLLGWLFKALALRDWTLLWAASIAFEVSEIILRHKFPNFFECWWDHLLLDVFGCNVAGMWIGMWLCKYFQMKCYTWGDPSSGARDYKTRLRDVFLPFTWSKYDSILWFSTRRNFLALCVVVFFLTIFDLNLFALKAILNLEPGHWICITRTILMGLAGTHSVGELHAVLQTPAIVNSRDTADAQYLARIRDAQLGTQTWSVIGILSAELLLAIRWAPTGVPNWHVPMPLYSKLIACTVIFAVTAIWYALGLQCSPKFLLAGAKHRCSSPRAKPPVFLGEINVSGSVIIKQPISPISQSTKTCAPLKEE